MKILVTGGGGFIGSHLVFLLQNAGHEVVVLDNFSSGFRENLDGFSGQLVEGSILDLECLAGAMEGVDVVYHLAAYTSVPGSLDAPRQCAELNVRGFLCVLEAARDAGCGRIVFASSAAVYGNGLESPKAEDLIPSPESPYALTKLDGERYLRMLAPHWGMDYAAVRFFNVFGPRQDANSGYAAAVPNFCQRAWAGRDLEIYGDGEQTRDFIYVEDLVGALGHVGECQETSGVYNAGYGEAIQVGDLAGKVIALTGSDSRIVNMPERAGDIRHSLANVDRLKAAGWRPSIGFDEGLARTVRFFSPGDDH